MIEDGPVFSWVRLVHWGNSNRRMIGALILLALNLFALRLAGEGPRALGLDRARRRSLEFSVGLLVAAGFAVLQNTVRAHLAGFEWMTNPAYGAAALLEGLRWNIASVLFEELIFRGALLWLLIRWLGPTRAALLSAASFGIYHWFSFGLFGNPVAMAFVFCLTGMFGAMLAASFVWSRSIALPVGLHLGWNLVTNELFSNGPLGARLLVASQSEVQALRGGEQLLVSVAIPLALPTLILLALSFPLRHTSPGATDDKTTRATS